MELNTEYRECFIRVTPLIAKDDLRKFKDIKENFKIERYKQNLKIR